MLQIRAAVRWYSLINRPSLATRTVSPWAKAITECIPPCPIRTARSLCPQGIFLPGDHELYRDYSRRLMAILETYSPLVEQVSVDEAYVDLTGTERLFGPPERTARLIQTRVQDELGLSISVGPASNKLVAKVASDLKKPAGFTVVAPGAEGEFLAPPAVGRLPGVGPALLGQLRDWGVAIVGDLARVPVRSLRHRALAARTVTVKIRYADYATHTCSRTLPRPLDVDEVFFQEALAFQEGEVVLRLLRPVDTSRARLRIWDTKP